MVSIWLMADLAASPSGGSRALRVVGELGFGSERVPVAAVGLGQHRRGLDAAAEAIARGAQRELRIDLELAGHVDGREQHIADLVEALRAVRGRLELVQLPPHAS